MLLLLTNTVAGHVVLYNLETFALYFLFIMVRVG